MHQPTGETLPEPVQVRCAQCGLAFTRTGKEDKFCSARCKRESLGVRYESVASTMRACSPIAWRG